MTPLFPWSGEAVCANFWSFLQSQLLSVLLTALQSNTVGLILFCCFLKASTVGSPVLCEHYEFKVVRLAFHAKGCERWKQQSQFFNEVLLSSKLLVQYSKHVDRIVEFDNLIILVAHCFIFVCTHCSLLSVKIVDLSVAYRLPLTNGEEDSKSIRKEGELKRGFHKIFCSTLDQGW